MVKLVRFLNEMDPKLTIDFRIKVVRPVRLDRKSAFVKLNYFNSRVIKLAILDKLTVTKFS